MTDEDKARVRAIIAESLGVEIGKVADDVRLCPDSGLAHLTNSGPVNLGGDSLDVVELVMAFEEAFLVEISDDVTETITRGTVADCFEAIDQAVPF